jgi:hypothetical protein
MTFISNAIIVKYEWAHEYFKQQLQIKKNTSMSLNFLLSIEGFISQTLRNILHNI